MVRPAGSADDVCLLLTWSRPIEWCLTHVVDELRLCRKGRRRDVRRGAASLLVSE